MWPLSKSSAEEEVSLGVVGIEEVEEEETEVEEEVVRIKVKKRIIKIGGQI